MNYKVSHKKATIEAYEFVNRYRDPQRMQALCGDCPSYGKSWGCPPHDFDVESVSDGFSSVDLLATIIEFDEQTRLACNTPAMAREAAERAMSDVFGTCLPAMYEMESQNPGSRCFTFRCQLCPEGCTRVEGLPCRHPERLRYSLEAVGFDVTAAARELLGIDLEWSSDGLLPGTITLVTALMKP